MKLNSMKNFGGAILGLLLFVGITLVSSTTAQAQYPYPNQDQYRRQQREAQRQAQRERQRQAQQSGWYDQYGNWHANGSNNQVYNNQGYYNRGRTTDNYGYYGGSSYARQTALNAGYNAGLRAGRDDRRSGRYNPYNHSEYRSATKDYNSRDGDRSAYQQYFREAFINGYSDGFRSGY
jgi:type II secretory pathway pseudopilin PulG